MDQIGGWFVGVVAIVMVGAGCGGGGWRPPGDLLTTSERSGFRATETHAEVVELLDRIADRSPLAARAALGETFEGREIPLLILADPPVADAASARAGGKLIVYLQACIHGGEVCGKPALIQLARDIALNPDSPDRALLDEMIIVMAPVYNADGNDRITPGNRGSAQNGPELGMGTRANAQGLDLNRDHMKLDSPEAKSLAWFLTEWRPHLTIDSHTTNGSLHQYALTYAAPQNPSGHSAPIHFVRDAMLPEVSSRLERRTGLRTFFYGNFNADRTQWRTYSHTPRFATPYRGLRNRMSILSEAYAYDTYEERVISTREFIRECLHFAAQRAGEIAFILDHAERETIAAEKGENGELIGIRYQMAAFSDPVTIAALERAPGDPGGALVARDVIVEHWGRFEPTLAVARPHAYLIPRELKEIVDKLREHGIAARTLPSARSIECEVYTVESIERRERPFQGRRLVTVEVRAERERIEWPAGTHIVPMDQPLANLAAYLLEPASDDGLATWGFFDGSLDVGARFPIVRAMR